MSRRDRRGPPFSAQTFADSWHRLRQLFHRGGEERRLAVLRAQFQRLPLWFPARRREREFQPVSPAHTIRPTRYKRLLPAELVRDPAGRFHLDVAIGAFREPADDGEQGVL